MDANKRKFTSDGNQAGMHGQGLLHRSLPIETDIWVILPVVLSRLVLDQVLHHHVKMASDLPTDDMHTHESFTYPLRGLNWRTNSDALQ
jgi:hypothetical protein